MQVHFTTLKIKIKDKILSITNKSNSCNNSCSFVGITKSVTRRKLRSKCKRRYIHAFHRVFIHVQSTKTYLLKTFIKFVQTHLFMYPLVAIRTIICETYCFVISLEHCERSFFMWYKSQGISMT